MCLGVPARVISVSDREARVAVGTVEYTCSLLLTEGVSPGDYVLLHAGFVIERIDTEEAEETIRLFREISENEPS